MPETPSLFDLKGKTALVTGCSRGIGLAIAAGLASAGADIIGVSTRLERTGSSVQQRVEGLGRAFTPYAADLTDRSAIDALVADLGGSHEIDILVNNAGIVRRAPALDHDAAMWDAVLELDLTAPFLLTRALGRTMVERGTGKVVFVASLLSFQGGLNVPSYAAAKSGIAGLTRALATEWAGSGVNVNAVAPGYIATDMTQALRDDAGRNAEILVRIPAGRWGHPDDLAGAVVFLASSASDYVHGTVLAVDGGWLAR